MKCLDGKLSVTDPDKNHRQFAKNCRKLAEGFPKICKVFVVVFVWALNDIS